MMMHRTHCSPRWTARVSRVLGALLIGLNLPLAAQLLEIQQSGPAIILSWDGEGILQSAPRADGPWTNDVATSSPHSVIAGGNRQFFRVWYPKGVVSHFEPPMMAFGEPNAEPAVVAHELSHAAQPGAAFGPEVDDEVLVGFFSGDLHHVAVDLHIKGRGLDFVWARRYRSLTGPNTAQGHRWDFSYNIRVERVGAHVRVFDGNGRADVFFKQSDGTYAADQFFREGRFESNGVFVLTFADTGVWRFFPFEGRPRDGRIMQIADRNGNTLYFTYDAQGRLTTITDTLNRPVTVAYDTDGFIDSVTDFTGRQVKYAYYTDPETGGSAGDLKSVRSPVVTNTPTLNDFPSGKTTIYTYSEGYADERENHLLLSITDPRGQTAHEFVYQHNQSNLDFLRCLAARVGYTTDQIHLHYVEQTPHPSNAFAVAKTIVNDRVGNVREHFYDAGNRLVMLRQFSGRANATQPTTETLNRPMNPLRPGDPAFFETRWEWNPDSLPTRVLYPNGNSVSNVYELALNPSAARRLRGNLRERHALPGPLGGDQPVITQHWTYDPRFGTDARHQLDPTRNRGFGFVTLTDSEGNSTMFGYDARGNCTNVIHRIPTIVEDFEYNTFGQMTVHVLPNNGSGHRRRDTFLHHTGGPQAGYLHQRIVDSGPNGLSLVTTYEYDARGNVVRRVDPRGHDEFWEYNTLDQPVRHSTKLQLATGQALPRHTLNYYYDANDNLVRICESNADENGLIDTGNAYITRVMEYDILNCLLHVCAESGSFNVPVAPPQLDCTGLPDSEFLSTEYEYDANRNLTLVRLGEAAEGRDTNNTVRILYDERDLVFQQVRAEGSLLQSTTQHDYDGNGNQVIVYTGLEAVPRITQSAYDGYNRRTIVTDAMGNVRYTMFNPNGVPIRASTHGEIDDVVGSVGNIRLNEVTNVLDAMDRLVRQDVSFFDTATQLPLTDGQSTRRFTWTGTSQLLRSVDDNNRTNRYAYDRINRLGMVTDPAGNQVLYTYDANSNPTLIASIEKSDLGKPDETFANRYVYDDLDRLIQTFDNISNTVQYAYDSRGNRVLTTDPLGVQTRTEFDGQSRQITLVQDMNANGANPADSSDIVLRSEWDDSSRLVQQVDDNTNVTTYVYDSLNRRVRELLADGTGTTNSYDVHDNQVTRRDANGNAMSYAYDLLNRVTNKTVVPGPGVSSDTTFERFRYDGLSRLVRAEDDDSLVQVAYNSLGSVLENQMNGQSTSASYDGVGNTLQCVYPGGRIVGYAYDPLNRIRAGLDASNSIISTYDFIGPDRMERMDYANSTRIDCFYDGMTGVPNPAGDFGVKRRIRTLHTLPSTSQVIDDRAYRWDRRYNKTARIDQRAPGPALRHDYGYDSAHRLQRGRVSASPSVILRDTHYALDGVGNRIAVTNNSVTEFYTMDATLPAPADFQVNQYTTGALGARTYDANGNLNALNPGGRDELLLEFDYADRLVRLTDSGNGLTNVYAYDALGRRIEMIVWRSGQPADVTRYYYGADWSSHANALQVVEEQDAVGSTLATYMYGGGLDDVMNMSRGGNDYHFHHDDLGNVMAVTDNTGAVVERYEYGDFGEPMFFDGTGAARPDSAIGNPHLFTGRRYDDETGLYYFRSRYLDPYAGRFITRDRLGTWGDPGNVGNGLAYVGNNPWTHTDPLGLAKEVFVRSKPHVNVGTIGHVDHHTAAGQKPKEIVVVGSKARSKRLFVGNLSWDTSAANSSDKRKQSLYFPESMLAEIKDEAGGHAHGHLDYLKKVGDPATGEPIRAGDVLLHRWQRSGVGHSVPLSTAGESATRGGDTGTHEVGHWMGLYHTFGHSAGDGDVDGRDFLVWQRGGSATSASADNHPDFLWWPAAGPVAQTDGAILVVSATDGPMPQASGACYDFPIPCPTCPNGYHMMRICPGGGGGGDSGGTLVLGGIAD